MTGKSWRTERDGPRELVAWLVAADLVVLLLHLLRRLPVEGGLGLAPPGSFWSLTDQRGMAASLELAQMGLASLLPLAAAWRRRTPALLLAAPALALVTLTEVFDLHLRLAAELRFLGALLAEAGVALPGVPKLLAGIALGGTALGFLLIAAAVASDRRDRRVVGDLLLILLLFLSLGGGLDLAGRLTAAARPALVTAEEMAELLIATFACARLLTSCRPPPAPSCDRRRGAPSGVLRVAAGG